MSKSTKASVCILLSQFGLRESVYMRIYVSVVPRACESVYVSVVPRVCQTVAPHVCECLCVSAVPHVRSSVVTRVCVSAYVCECLRV